MKFALWNRSPALPPAYGEADILKADAIAAAVRARRALDPLICVKLGAKALHARCVLAAQEAAGLHDQTLLGMLGALAGFACPAAVAADLAALGTTPEQGGIVLSVVADGRHLWCAPAIDALLAEDDFSVWSLVAGQAQALGAAFLPDLDEVRARAAAGAGEGFAAVRLPREHRPRLAPVVAARQLWPAAHPTLLRFCERPAQWPLLVSLAAQEAQRATSETLDPAVAAAILIDYAVATASLAPDSLAPPPR